jgi:hypothetical protein
VRRSPKSLRVAFNQAGLTDRGGACFVSRRTPVACSMRRKDHSSFPSAMTCCFFASLKILLIPTEAIAPLAGVNVLALSLAGFG